jgi:hypothetical protein
VFTYVLIGSLSKRLGFLRKTQVSFEGKVAREPREREEPTHIQSLNCLERDKAVAVQLAAYHVVTQGGM